MEWLRRLLSFLFKPQPKQKPQPSEDPYRTPGLSKPASIPANKPASKGKGSVPSFWQRNSWKDLIVLFFEGLELIGYSLMLLYLLFVVGYGLATGVWLPVAP